MKCPSRKAVLWNWHDPSWMPVSQRQGVPEVLSKELILSVRWLGASHVLQMCLTAWLSLFDTGTSFFKERKCEDYCLVVSAGVVPPEWLDCYKRLLGPIPLFFSVCCWCCDKTPNTSSLVSLYFLSWSILWFVKVAVDGRFLCLFPWEAINLLPTMIIATMLHCPVDQF